MNDRFPKPGALFTDPRVFQILSLGLLLTAGALTRDLSIRPAQVALVFLAGIGTQALGNRLTGKPEAGLRSAIITCFGLSILLRADTLWVHPAAAALAIGQKFLVRVGGKHVLNPANSGVILSLLLFPGTWVSAGQWGSDVALAGWFLVLGNLVCHRAAVGGIAWSFLLFHLGALACRVAHLGYEWTVWTHQLQSGALLLFAFFMISDPMTIPNDRRARVLHAAIVAAAAFAWQFHFYGTNGLLWALFLAAPLVPLADRIFPAPKFEWIPQPEGGCTHEHAPALPARLRPGRRRVARLAA